MMHFIIAYLLIIASLIFGVAAVWANPFYGMHQHRSKKPGQVTVCAGPYRIIRHPGYSSGFFLCVGLILLETSFYFIFLWGGIMFLIIFQIRREDNRLFRDLDDYADYAKKVKYRMIPGVW